MPGLMGQGQQMQSMPQDEGNVSPEEQDKYEAFVKNGMEIIYNKDIIPQLLQNVAQAPSPQEGLANAASLVVMRLEDSAEQNNVQVDGEIKMQGGLEIMEALTELVEAAGIHEYTEEEMEGAYYQAIDKYRETRQAQGKLNPADYEQDMQMLIQADRQNALDQVVPGASQAAQRMKGVQNV